MAVGGEKKVFTFDDVAEHNTSKDCCWLIIGGKVYDVTSFKEEHPGGDDVLFSATRKDASDDFEDVGHSTDARRIMEKFCVGEMDMSTIPKKVTYTPSEQPHYNHDKTKDFILRVLQFLLPLLILSVALSIKFYSSA